MTSTSRGSWILSTTSAFAVAVTALLTMHAHTAQACTCELLTLEQRAAAAESVFVGRVGRIHPIALSYSGPTSIRVLNVDFDVLLSIKGPRDPIIQVLTYEGDGGACGARILPGENYIVFARVQHRYGRHQLFANGCSILFASRLQGDIDTQLTGVPIGDMCPKSKPVASASILNSMKSNPRQFMGWGQLENPNSRPSPYNRWRTWLEPRNHSLPPGPWNPWVWKGGCS